MEHVVFFPAPDGTPAFRRVASLEDAVRLVEHLRNVEGVNEVSVHALSEVPLAFKAWYRVEVPAEAAPAAEPVLEAAAQPAVEAAVEPLSFEVPGIVPDAVAPEAPVALAPELVVPEQGEHQDPVPEQEPVVVLAASNGEQVQRPSSLGFFAS